MADRRHGHVDLVDSIEVQPPCQSMRLDSNANSVSIDNILTIPCAVSGNTEGSRHASSQVYPQTGGSIFEDRQTIDEMFSFINESGESEFENTRAGWVANVPFGAQSSHRSSTQKESSVPQSLHRHVPRLPLSTIKHNSIISTSVKTENIDNYNSMDKVKLPSPTKEIDVFLPEEKTIDLSLNTRSWKGRTPPSHLIDIDISDIAVESVGTVDDKKISNYAADPPDQLNEERMRSGSFENIPGTGKHINTIQIRRDSSSARPPVPKERKISRERKHLKTHQKPTIKNDGCKSNETPQAQNLLRLSRRKSERRDEPVPSGIGNSLIIDLEKDDKRMLEKNTCRVGTGSSPLEVIPMRKAATAGQHKQISRLSNNRHRDTVDAKEEFSIYGVVTQANVPSIHSLNFVPNDIQVSVSSHDQQSAVMRPIMSSHGVANTELKKHLKINQRTSPQSRNATHLRQARDENINVYVNVNVNMNNNDFDQKLQPTKHYPSFRKMDLASTDISDPLIQYHDFSDSTEKSQSSSLFSDDELSSSKSESSSQSEYAADFTKDPSDSLNNQALQLPSHISGNRFRISSHLGPGGLSPIPSESYESDSTNCQVYASGCEHGKKSPTLSEYSIPSSNTTITCDISDNEMDGMSSTRRASAKRQRGTHRSAMPSPTSRKISYEENEATIRKLAGVDGGTGGPREDWRGTEYEIRTPIIRSYSQPEHFMLAKRQTEIDKMRPNMAHHDIHDGISHTRLDKTSSEPLPSSRIGLVKKDGKDDRLPLNVQLATEILSSEDNDGSMAGTSRSDFDNAIARHDIRRSSWQPKSPYSSRVSRTSSMLSEGSRSGRTTRQLSVDIGEEWENVHQTQRARTVSDVGSVSSGVSYRSLRTKRIYAAKLTGTDDLIISNIPGIDQNLIQPPHIADEFVPSDLQVTEEIVSPVAELREGAQDGSRPIVDTANPVVIQVTSRTKEDLQYIVSPEPRILLDNPYNSINQRFHSALHCPCFLFFCFLCCAPAVYWMQRSDYEFDYASETLAKRFGRRATGLYITGAAMSIILLSAAILIIYLLLEDEMLKVFP